MKFLKLSLIFGLILIFNSTSFVFSQKEIGINFGSLKLDPGYTNSFSKESNLPKGVGGLIFIRKITKSGFSFGVSAGYFEGTSDLLDVSYFPLQFESLYFFGKSKFQPFLGLALGPNFVRNTNHSSGINSPNSISKIYIGSNACFGFKILLTQKVALEAGGKWILLVNSPEYRGWNFHFGLNFRFGKNQISKDIEN